MVGQWRHNYSEEEIVCMERDFWYDLLLYVLVPLEYIFLFMFLFHITHHQLSTLEYIGNVAAMGILSGTIGINVAHELGHRTGRWDRFLAKALLLTTTYMHFYIEHNRGHHKRVSTEEDPASARFNEPVYTFLLRTITFSFLSAWKLEAERMLRLKLSRWNIRNLALQFVLIQVAFLAVIYLLFGTGGVLGFVISSLIGIVLLEIVNYIQHCGLERKHTANGTYEQVQPNHSWNSGYPIGQILLFQLGRHSDHHFKASKKYQILEYRSESPQMPTGYTGMIVMALVPLIWFRVMNPLVKKYKKND